MGHQTATQPLQISIDLYATFHWIQRYWFECIAIFLILYLVPLDNKEFEFSIGGFLPSFQVINTSSFVSGASTPEPGEVKKLNISTVNPVGSPAARPVGAFGNASAPDFNDVSPLADDPAPHISNLTLILSPDYAERKKLPREIVEAKWARVRNYVQRFAPAAQREMRDYGIPASITLAQGLLESNAGDSRLARESNNHFGIKCRSKCRGCTCRNYRDDSAYDMFRVFENTQESYREHSILLSSSRYSKLKDYGTDYVQWAHGLKKAGYATDKRYAHKLIKIIERLNLHTYDQL